VLPQCTRVPPLLVYRHLKLLGKAQAEVIRPFRPLLTYPAASWFGFLPYTSILHWGVSQQME